MMYHEVHRVHYLGAGDPYVFTEQKRDYGKVAERARGKRVLDFGAHCGFFNVFLSRDYAPDSIISVEPDPRAEEVLRKNIRPDTELHMAAVVDHSFPELTVPLYLGKTFSATNSVEPYQGRKSVEVPVIHFQELLRTGVQFIKCDCEGGEYSLNWDHLPETVETIAIEYHFNRPDWANEMVHIDESLLAQGFKHIRKPKENTFRKIDTGLYVRG